jgi:uncharacterized repeat protein (TIGR03806 family)
MALRCLASCVLLPVMLGFMLVDDARSQTPAPLQRVANTTLQMPQVPQSLGYKTVPAFGTLTFNNPVALRAPTGETNRLFVVEQGGKVFVITNLTAPNKTLYLDLSRQVLVGQDTGLFALAFHPGYQTNGYFFVGYHLTTQTAGGTGLHFRVSRVSVSQADPNSAFTNSELPLITQHIMQSDTGFATCNDLQFGPEGYLYIAVGNSGDPGATAQAINGNFYGGILRIDVDKNLGNLTPNPHPAVTTNYAIPSDNPFVGATNFNGAPVDPANVRTEYYAVGLRNPWRMSFDPLAGLLYVGDPGTTLRDEIDVIVKGGNYGWPYREGTGPGPKAGNTPAGLRRIDPIFQRGEGAIIGGVVYRGENYPQLQGTYIFGDWVAGQVYALRYAGTNLVTAQTLTAQAGVVSFGLDPSNGDVLVVNHEGGRIMRLTYSTILVGTPLPSTLVDTGVFVDAGTLAPNAGIVPYDLNVPFWSDNATKRRWFSVPNVGNTIGFSRDSSWSFPVGTVWVKHFELELTNGVPESARRLETRLLVRTTTGVYGVTYRWGDSRTNAVLVPEGGLDETFTIQDSGVVRTQVWHYPSRSECLTCHTPLAGYALGFNTGQLNRDVGYWDGAQSQLRALSGAGYFQTNLSKMYALPTLAHPTNDAVSLDFRVRSYLAANCFQCHQPGGASLGHFDTRLATPLSASSLVDGMLVDSLGDSENRVVKPGSPEQSVLLTRIANLGPNHMPPLATSVLNQQAIDLLSRWITGSATNYHSYADWQVSHFGSTSVPGSAPGEDPDGDGASNELEYLTGTDPLTAGDGWRIHFDMTAAATDIHFLRIANRGFEVQWTTDLSDPNSWRPLDVPGNEPVFGISNTLFKVTDTLANDTLDKFYRVRILEP